MTGNLLVIHLTQGSTLDGAVRTLRANRSWSNTVYDPRANTEHVFTESPDGDRSLRNLAGGVETNNRPGVWQIEIVGFSEHVTGYPDGWYRRLATYLHRKCNDWDIPYRFPHDFKGSQQAYGARSSTRLTPAQWMAATGIVGHQHVPENSHWDPGPIDVARLVRYAPTDQEAPMAEPPTDFEIYVRAIQGALVAAGIDIGTTGPAGNGIDDDLGQLTVNGVQQLGSEAIRLRAEVAELRAALDTARSETTDPVDVTLAAVGEAILDIWDSLGDARTTIEAAIEAKEANQ